MADITTETPWRQRHLAEGMDLNPTDHQEAVEAGKFDVNEAKPMLLWESECFLTGGILSFCCQAETKEEALTKMQAKAGSWWRVCLCPQKDEILEMVAVQVDGVTVVFTGE